MDLEILKWVKFVGALLAIIAALYSLTVREAPVLRKRAILLFWLVAPPVFFYFEYYFQAPLLHGSDLERFKDLQALAASIWAGIAAALAVMYFKD